MKKFSETQPVQDNEEREQIKTGMIFVISGFVIQDSKKYKEGVAKINGNDTEGKEHKYWTTGAVIIHQLKNMAESVGIDSGKLKEKIMVRVITVKGKSGQDYLSLSD